ncbi:FKBP-type peptidyl-prolyl cis-trans isomerase [Terasakiella sp. SH-1]|uniref:FKBP-type peptidyl-prolyl cis-trans isomerase n=1 Tax=Terasakiella sp. SH-1 TaxID=2560057 RepID=UPI00107471D6|nr:FKBP-type peptidyl-prolyl cis-trans isomerase [Terasakiella sp. SH-1]
MSQLENGQTVKVLVTFTMEDSTVIPASPDGTPLELIVGEPCGFVAIDTALPSMSMGESRTLKLSPDEAFGMPDPNLRFDVPRTSIQVEGDLQPGVALQMNGEDGQVFTAIVHEVSETSVLVDANHPLAGEALECKIDVVG